MVHESQQPTLNRSARQTREVVRRLGKLTEAQAAMGWGIILLIVTLIGAIYLNQSSKVALVGRNVQQLEYDYNEVQRINAQFEREIAEAQSLERLSREMGRLGFVPSSNADIEYLLIPDYPAMAATPVTLDTKPTKPAGATVDTIQEALLLVLRDRIDDLMRGESGEQ